MILPKWTRQQTQSTDVRDAVRAVDLSLTNKSFQGGTWDIASHEPMTYRDMILRSAEVLGKNPKTVDFPADCIGISKLWVAAISQTSPRLVYPLLASLKHSLVAKDNDMLHELKKESIPFEQSVRDSVDEEGRPVDSPVKRDRRAFRRKVRKGRRVRSVQRMPLPRGWNAPKVAAVYSRWLTRSSGSIINVVRDSETGVLRFLWRWPELVLLELHPSEFTVGEEYRTVFYIKGGLLLRPGVDPPGRFEFRLVENRNAVIAAIHEFSPRLPWIVYQYTQAVVHLFVMNAFEHHLQRMKVRQEKVDRRNEERPYPAGAA